MTAPEIPAELLAQVERTLADTAHTNVCGCSTWPTACCSGYTPRDWAVSPSTIAALTEHARIVPMTAETSTSLKDLYAEALDRSLPQWWQTPPRLDVAADAVAHVRDAELERLRIQVADYERQLIDAEKRAQDAEATLGGQPAGDQP